MPGFSDVINAVKFTPLLKGSDALSARIRKRLFSPYQFYLLLHDFIGINLGFILAALITVTDFFFIGDLIQYTIISIFSLIFLGFFQTFNLYSYHQIFFKKSHVKHLAKAFGLSILSIGIVILTYSYPLILEGKSAFLIIFLAAVGVLIVSRFLWNHILNIIRAVGMSFVAVGIIALLSPEERPIILDNWMTIPTGVCLAGAIIFISRTFMVQVVFNKWMRRRFRQQIAIVGSDLEAETITSHIINQNAPFFVQGIICEKEVECLDTSVPKNRLGELKDLPNIVNNNEIDEIIVTDESINQRILISLLDYCTSEGITVWFPPKLLPIIDMKLYIDNFCGLPMIRLCSQKNSWVFNKIKHALDALMALPIFLVLVPIFFVISILIKWNSKGPIFYRANAIGKDGKRFTMFKFRSMRVESDSGIHKDYVTKLIKGEINYEGKKDQVFKITDDPRITSVGKILRKFSLDELPQIINILKGDMSLVGPRPCLPYEYEAYEDWHKKRASVRPGITGLWQVAGRSAVTFEDMILLDLYYIYNRSILMDMSIIYETIYSVLGKRGAH